MAESAVSFLLGKLDSLLLKEVKLLRGVHREIEEIRYELESMKSFLKDADTREDSDEGVRTWVKQVREVAYDIEDVLDEFVLCLEQPQGYGFNGFLHKSARFMKGMNARRRIAVQMQDIRTRIHSIAGRRITYSFNTEEGSSCSAGNSTTWHDPRQASLFKEDAEIIGISKPREELTKWLVGGESLLKVISVVGMGGLGKTTLVRKVYDSQQVKRRFECFAWITVSQSFKIVDLLRSMIEQLFEARKVPFPEGLDKMKEVRLIEIIKDCLWQRRYVVVFDDIWHINAWECIRYGLPDSQCGSRIMVTTRLGDIGSSCIESSGHIYHMQPLTFDDAWSLFCKKAFRSQCPLELEGMSKDIVKRCGGLPIAIVAIGGLLWNKTCVQWQMVQRALGSELERNRNLESLKRILMLSYNDLPYYLKSCFLYFSIFPEDYQIRCARLIRLWVAEGFVEEREGKTMEDVAGEYLNELISRSMVQVARFDFDGRARTCQVHDIMREIILTKCREENFSRFCDAHNTRVHEKVRRLSVLTFVANVQHGMDFSHLRSLFMFGITKLSTSSKLEFFTRLRLLKVLDLPGAPIKTFPSELTNLIHLRYLSLRRTKISELPTSLGKLRNLETLDLKGTHVTELPFEILELQCLCNLLVYRYRAGIYIPFENTQGVIVPMGIGSLRGLQKLSFVEASQGSCTVRELRHLTQLKRLGITKLRQKDRIDCCSSVSKMKYLQSFSAKAFHEEEFLDLQPLSSPPPLLQRLYLKGRLEKLPHWIASLQNLVKLRLWWSRLENDPFQGLQPLPNLVELMLNRAYDGEWLCCEAGGFSKLKMLFLDQMSGLNLVKVDKGAMPDLRVLNIRRCEGLKKLPLGIEHLTGLKELLLFDMPEDFVERLRGDDGEDRWKVKNVSVIRCVFSRDEHLFKTDLT